MIRSSDDQPLSEEAVVLALANYFHELQDAQIKFEELWFATGKGEQLPEPESVNELLRLIAGRAKLMEFAFTSLRILREHPHLIEPNHIR